MDILKPIHILLADDDEDDRELFEQTIRDLNIHADLLTLVDGQQLILHLGAATAVPDIVFLDINMPKKNGKECLRDIRRMHRFDHVPIIMFSTSVDATDIYETLTGGANLYVHKPSTFEEQLQMFRSLFADGWRDTLLNPEKKRYVLSTTMSYTL